MKLSEFLTDIGQPFAYYPQVARMVGGVKEGIFLCRIVWWQHQSGDWVTRSMDEISQATGLSLFEQRSARKQLKALGILEESLNRLAHEMSYRLNLDALDKLWADMMISRSEETSLGGVKNPHIGECRNCISSIGKDLEKDSTKEEPPYPPEGGPALDRLKPVLEAVWPSGSRPAPVAVASKPKASVHEAPLVIPAVLSASPEFVSKWTKWMTARRAMKKSKDFGALFQEQLEWLAKFTPEVAVEILSASIMNGWQGLFPPKNGHGPNGNGKIPAWQERKEWQEQLKRAEDEIKTLMSGDSHTDLDFVDKATMKRARAVRDEMRQKLGYKV